MQAVSLAAASATASTPLFFGGAVQSAPTSEWEGGSRYDPASVYYHQMRGMVTGYEEVEVHTLEAEATMQEVNV